MGAMTGQDQHEDLAQVLEEVPPVGNLNGLRSALAGSSGIIGTPITADDFDPGTVLEPGSHRRGGAVR